jgi:hypothetical protein
MKQLSKHISAATNIHTAIEEALDMYQKKIGD